MEYITVPAKTESLTDVTAFIEEALAETGCLPRTQAQINIAVEELFVNIAHYAYETEGSATIGCDVAGGMATITFIDSGAPYNPLLKEDANTSMAAHERQIGGLGILIVKKSMDDIDYRYEDGKNILTIKKQLP